MIKLREAISKSNQATARAAISAGDRVCVTLESTTTANIPFQGRRAIVRKTTPNSIYVGILRFDRDGQQVGARKGQPVRYTLAAMTADVDRALADQEAE